jgi:HSP90 family molecular chaperone
VAQSRILSRTARENSASVQFRVDPRLATLLGEGYRSSEHALKELVDNAWDADATRVEVTLPGAFTSDPIVVTDNGSGMTRLELEQDYLVIANDRRTRKGELTHGLRRPVKGRKGIGKFAGLMVADIMDIETRARENSTSVRVSKDDLPANGELESIDLPVSVGKCTPDSHGTTIRLSSLAQALEPPSPERFKQLLVLEYGRQEQFEIVVNGEIAGVEDIPGQTFTETDDIPSVGPVSLCFTVADGKKPLKQAGIAIRVTVDTPHG